MPTWSGRHPQKDLAKFGYRSQRKVEKFSHRVHKKTSPNLATCQRGQLQKKFCHCPQKEDYIAKFGYGSESTDSRKEKFSHRPQKGLSQIWLQVRDDSRKV